MRDTLVGYDFKDFQEDFERLNQQHPHVIRREYGITYKDEFAFEQIQSLAERLPEQILSGWSRSYYLPEKHMEAILQFSTANVPAAHTNLDIYAQSMQEVRHRFSGLRVRAFDVLSELDKVSFKSSSSAGYDYAGRKGPYLGENHERAIRRAKATLWSAIADDGEGIEHVLRTSVPDVGYTRTQLADLLEKTKVRQVWGRSFHYILLEGIVADPFIQAIKTERTFIHAGLDPTISVPALLSETSKTCSWLYGLDWKHFDATVSRFEINAAFDLIKDCIIFPNFESEQAYEITRQLFIHKKVAAPDGYVYWTHKGIPSGSYYTSIVGSIINFLRINYLWRLITGQPPKMLSTLGDDSLVGYDDYIDPRRIGEEANKVGWFFNPEKTEYSRVPEEITFLGRTFTGGLNKRDLTKCIRLLAFPEYPVTSGRISAYRAQSIADDAGGLSEILNRVAVRLRRIYGIASEDEVPFYFKPYVPGI